MRRSPEKDECRRPGNFSGESWSFLCLTVTGSTLYICLVSQHYQVGERPRNMYVFLPLFLD
jgi:hypothetical protein